MSTPWDASDCLALFNRKAGRPTSDAGVPDASKYDRLAKSQDRVIAMLASVVPHVLYQKVGTDALPALTTSDGNVFRFGSDSYGNPLTPIGKVAIYPSLTAIPDAPWREGRDYLNEGTQIRLPSNRTWSGSLYWRGIVTPAPISVSVAPALFPLASRELIVIDAVLGFAEEGARNPELAALMQSQWDAAWPKWCLVWRTQFRAGGALYSGAITGVQQAELAQLA